MNIGRVLVAAGLTIAALGLFLILVNKANIPVGRLPGDLVWRGKHSTVYFPWVTCLILSLAGTPILWLINRRP
jgi:hypothetical protein